jgi:hypothetical protein
VLNEFELRNARYSKELRHLYLDATDGRIYVLDDMDIECTAIINGIKVKCFFSLKHMKCAMIFRSFGGNHIRCGIMPFWIDNDVPVPATKWLAPHDEIMSQIYDSFQEQYAAILIDREINS